MCVPIQRVFRDSSGVVTHVAGFAPDGRAWGLTVADAVALAESWEYSWFVEEPSGQRVPTAVRTSSSGRKYLTTSPDGITANNLDALPNLPNPLEGVMPPYPLSIPGDTACMLMSINSVSYGMNGTKHTLSTTAIQNPPGQVSGPAPVLQPPANFWSGPTPHRLYLETTLPFPAYYSVQVTVNSGTTAYARHMEWVSASDNYRQRQIEASGAGWWTWIPVLTKPDGTPDPSLPARLTPVTIVINLGTATWTSQFGDPHIELIATTANPYCRTGSGGWAGFALHRPATAAPPPQTPQTVTVPNVVGLRLDDASRRLWALQLSVTTPFSPIAPAGEIEVVSQSPAAGTVVNLHSGVSLGTVLANPPTGPSQLIVHNNYNRSKPVDFWLYDVGGGSWQKKATIAFGDHESVDLDSGHMYQVAAIDQTLNNCHTGDPSDVSCVCWTLINAVVAGDDPGVDVWIN